MKYYETYTISISPLKTYTIYFYPSQKAESKKPKAGFKALLKLYYAKASTSKKQFLVSPVWLGFLFLAVEVVKQFSKAQPNSATLVCWVWLSFWKVCRVWLSFWKVFIAFAPKIKNPTKQVKTKSCFLEIDTLATNFSYNTLYKVKINMYRYALTINFSCNLIPSSENLMF